MVCPFTGEQLRPVPVIEPDAALVHAQYGDARATHHPGTAGCRHSVREGVPRRAGDRRRDRPDEPSNWRCHHPAFDGDRGERGPVGAIPPPRSPLWIDRRQTARSTRPPARRRHLLGRASLCFVDGVPDDADDPRGSVAKTRVRLSSWRDGPEAWNGSTWTRRWHYDKLHSARRRCNARPHDRGRNAGLRRIPDAAHPARHARGEPTDAPRMVWWPVPPRRQPRTALPSPNDQRPVMDRGASSSSLLVSCSTSQRQGAWGRDVLSGLRSTTWGNCNVTALGDPRSRSNRPAAVVAVICLRHATDVTLLTTADRFPEDAKGHADSRLVEAVRFHHRSRPSHSRRTDGKELGHRGNGPHGCDRLGC